MPTSSTMPSFTYVVDKDGKIQSPEEEEKKKCLERLQEQKERYSRGDPSLCGMCSALGKAGEVGLEDHILYKTVYRMMQRWEAKIEETTLRKDKLLAEVAGESFRSTWPKKTTLARVKDLSKSSTSELHHKLRELLGEIHFGDDLTVNAKFKQFLRLVEGEDKSRIHARIAKFLFLLSRAEQGKNWMVDLVLVIIAEDRTPNWHVYGYRTIDCSEYSRPIAMRIWKLLKSVVIVPLE